MDLVGIRETLTKWIVKPLVPILIRSRLKPDTLTLIGLALNGVAAAAIATRHFLWAGFLVLFSGLFDLLDGAIARLTNQTTSFGALLDSVVDRFSEAVLFLGLLALYVREPSELEIVLVFLVLIGSFLISYIRARAEGLGIKCHVGWFTRAERVVVLALGLLLNQVLIALSILVVLTFVTVGQRLVYVWQKSRR